MEPKAVQSPDLFQKANGVCVAAHEQVLAVIDDISCDGIGEGIGAAAKMPAALQQEDFRAALAQLDRCREAGESSSDYDDAFRHY